MTGWASSVFVKGSEMFGEWILGRTKDENKKHHQETYYLVTLQMTLCQEAFFSLELVVSTLVVRRKDQLFDWTYFQKMSVDG